MVGGRVSSFTVNCQFFSLLSTDGRLRIWDTSSGKLVQEFSPALKAESSCTCLCWTRSRGKSKEPKKKKRKTITESTDDQYPLILLGTKGGDTLTYDIVSGELGKTFTGGHASDVNDIKFVADNDTVYTCSKDKYIIEWSFQDYTIQSKWKADKSGINKIAVGPSGETLLSAGQSIKLWNLKTKELLQRFNGHSSVVTLLQFSPYRSPVNDKSFDDGYYFLSGALEDRIINAWHINSSSKDKTAKASFRLSDIPIFMDSLLISKDSSLRLCVGCKDGRIHFFNNTLNGNHSRPLESSKTIDMLEKNISTDPVPSLFIDAVLLQENDMPLMLVHGSSLKPLFKKLEYSKLEIVTKIVEELTENLLINGGTHDGINGLEPEIAKQNSKSKMIGNTIVSLPGVTKELKSRVNLDLNENEQDRSITEMEETLGEKLRGAWPENTPHKLRPISSTPGAGSFSQMLIQALHSGDDILLHDVLFKVYADDILKNTIKRIPNNLVGKLLTAVVDKLQRNPARSKDLSSWLKNIMAVHLTQLITNETLHKTMASLFQLLTAQHKAHPLLLNLQGKIDLLYTHANNVKSSSDDDDVNSAAVVFNDDSEDEAEALFGKLMESEDEGKEDSGLHMDEEEGGNDDDDTSEDEHGDDHDVSLSDAESDV